MKAEFWRERWRSGATGWHQAEVNSALVQHWPSLNLPPNCLVFVPLCGKSLDMVWLRQAGHRVIGVELVEDAVRSFFEERGASFKMVNTPNNLPRFSGGGIHIYCGDYLQLSAAHLEDAPGAFDRGALIALPSAQRAVYADHMQRILPEGTQVLLLTLSTTKPRRRGRHSPSPPRKCRPSTAPVLHHSRTEQRSHNRPAPPLPGARLKDRCATRLPHRQKCLICRCLNPRDSRYSDCTSMRQCLLNKPF